VAEAPSATALPCLDPVQIRRYGRQILLDDIGGRGQRTLLAATAMVELGDDLSAALVAIAYLAGAGIGTLLLTGAVDRLVTTADIGFLLEPDDLGGSRFEAIGRRVRSRNPDVEVRALSAGVESPARAVVVHLEAALPPEVERLAPPEAALAARWARALWCGGSGASTAIAELLTGSR
jgi:hypothetical protein